MFIEFDEALYKISEIHSLTKSNDDAILLYLTKLVDQGHDAIVAYFPNQEARDAEWLRLVNILTNSLSL